MSKNVEEGVKNSRPEAERKAVIDGLGTVLATHSLSCPLTRFPQGKAPTKVMA
ncbi:hypothetical protein FACS189475_08620 [Betaproteobacteria bacterium]|nr:hypothetical protein FACS189475_08620 [Betaproteobacteria bacterium]